MHKEQARPYGTHLPVNAIILSEQPGLQSTEQRAVWKRVSTQVQLAGFTPTCISPEIHLVGKVILRPHEPGEIEFLDFLFVLTELKKEPIYIEVLSGDATLKMPRDLERLLNGDHGPWEGKWYPAD